LYRNTGANSTVSRALARESDAPLQQSSAIAATGHGSYSRVMSLERSGRQGSSDSYPDTQHGAARVAGKDNAAARRYAGVTSPVVQAKPRGNAGQASSPVLGAPVAPDAAEPAHARTQDVLLEAGELLKVDVSSQEPVELVVLSQQSGVVFQGHAVSRQITYQAPVNERVRVQTRPAAGGLPLGPGPSARVMVSVEPPERAQTSAEGDGAAYLNVRQHLLLNMFGVNPESLHPSSSLELAKALDALEIIARALGAAPQQAPSDANDHALTTTHNHAGVIEDASYELTGTAAVLRLVTNFDHSSGALHCHLSFDHINGSRITGNLTHTVALSDGRPSVPASDPVGEYLQHAPGAYGELDDFSDAVADSPARPSKEGIGSFLEGAVAGEFAENDSWSAVAGQVVTGFIPIAGQVADARDIAAAGSDLFQGKEGAWAALGIAIIAVIPGLDFLKGGSKAGRKALKDASEGAVEGVTRAGVKRIGKTISKEAAARATRELKALAVAREEMLVRMQGMLLDEGLSEASKNTIRRVRNSVQDHLHPSDLSGALRDRLGLQVRKSGSGEAWNHLGEVKDVLNSLKKLHTTMRRELFKLEPGSPGYGVLSRELSALSEMIRRVQKFLEIK
jgi:hypothetical protein